jgi:hypothetical protein
MAQTSERSKPESVGGDVTPELALVDPDLARRAREQLPDAAARVPAGTEIEPISSGRGRRRFGRVVLATLALVGAAAVGLAVPSLLLEDRTAAPSTTAPQSAPAAEATDPASIAASPPGAAEEASAPDAPAAGVARTFGWVPSPRASHYHVAIFRGERKIFEAWPRRPPLVVRATWAFKGRRFALAPGEYRWTVRPGFGRRSAARYGRPIVNASLVIPG